MTKGWLQAEFFLFYLAVPVGLAVAVPTQSIFPFLFGFTLLGAVLLHLTPGFRWRELAQGWRRIDGRVVAGFAVAVGVVCTAIMLWQRPELFLYLAQRHPETLGLVVVFYPLVSALPQELLYRVLFFRRYSGLMPGRWAAIWINAGVFSLAHLLYWNWPAIILTFVGGLIFAWAYEQQKSFPLAVLLHAIAGWVLFTLGMGAFFFTGFVERPF